MLEACSGDVTNDSFRNRLLTYFNISRFSSFVDSCVESTSPLYDFFNNIEIELDSPIEAADLRGQVIRQLEAYPENPPLLLLRSVSETFASDTNENVVVQNFEAFLNFSSSKWDMEKTSTYDLAIKHLLATHDHDPELAKKIFGTIMSQEVELEIENDIYSKVPDNFAWDITSLKISRIVEKVDTLL